MTGPEKATAPAEVAGAVHSTPTLAWQALHDNPPACQVCGKPTRPGQGLDRLVGLCWEPATGTLHETPYGPRLVPQGRGWVPAGPDPLDPPPDPDDYRPLSETAPDPDAWTTSDQLDWMDSY